jgi:hypothetical protein
MITQDSLRDWLTAIVDTRLPSLRSDEEKIAYLVYLDIAADELREMHDQLVEHWAWISDSAHRCCGDRLQCCGWLPFLHNYDRRQGCTAQVVHPSSTTTPCRSKPSVTLGEQPFGENARLTIPIWANYIGSSMNHPTIGPIPSWNALMGNRPKSGQL